MVKGAVVTEVSPGSDGGQGVARPRRYSGSGRRRTATPPLAATVAGTSVLPPGLLASCRVTLPVKKFQDCPA